MILADITFLVDVLRKKASVVHVLEKRADESIFATEVNVFDIYLGVYISKIIAKYPTILEKRVRK